MQSDAIAVPYAPGKLPIFGHALQLGRDPMSFLASLRDGGGLVRVDLGTMPMYVATSARMVHEVTVKQARSFEKGRLFDRVRPLVGNGLANSNGAVHRAHRQIIQPLFHQRRLGRYAEIMIHRARVLSHSWKPGQFVDIEATMSAYAIETLAQTMFGTDLGQSAVEVVRRDLPIILKNMLLRAASPAILDRIPIGPNRAFDSAASRLRDVIDNVIDATRNSDTADRDDLVSILLASRHERTGAPLTDLEIRDQIVTFLFAGTETVASTLSWALYELSRNPEVDNQIAAQLNDVIGDRPVTIEDIPQLTAIHRVLNEAVRLYSVTLLMRRTTSDVRLGPYILHAGAEVAFSLYALHRDPVVFERPEEFIPDRWLPERCTTVAREEFIPFGAGNRRCIGDKFAWIEATVVMATLLRRWKLRPAVGCTPKPAAAAMPHPDFMPMLVEPRYSGREVSESYSAPARRDASAFLPYRPHRY
ncbi:cytochrome P450 [Streptomyces vinaceus]